MSRSTCNECRDAHNLTWLGMCVGCTLAEVERRLAKTRRVRKDKDLADR
jgi:hypothetical protein